MLPSGPLILEKAKLLHDHLSGAGGASTSAAGTSGTSSLFTASIGWFHRFKVRYNFRNINLVGECASVDHDADKAFPAELTSLIEGKGYLPGQVFNADTTGLFWEKMPTRMFISQCESKAAGFKAAKDRVSLLLCTNAEEDFLIKPVMLYRSLKPRVLKNKNKQVLPVYWRVNRKVWVTSELLMDWFHNCFVPQVERYLAEKNLFFQGTPAA